jgi:hypothetical protein
VAVMTVFSQTTEKALKKEHKCALLREDSRSLFVRRHLAHSPLGVSRCVFALALSVSVVDVCLASLTCVYAATTMNGLTAQDNPFVRHLLERKCFLNQTDRDGNVQNADNLTNYLMDGCRGGKVIIKGMDYARAMEVYADAIMGGYKLFLIERRTPIYKTLTDFDCKTNRELDPKEITEMLLLIQSTHKLFWDPIKGGGKDRRFMMVVCSTPMEQVKKKKTFFGNIAVVASSGSASSAAAAAASSVAPPESEEPPTYKYGKHLVFPNLRVDDAQSNIIYASCVVKARQRWPDPKKTFGILDEWGKVIDQSVIVKNGLRLVGSNKQGHCPDCHGSSEKREVCGTCYSVGKVDLKRPYMLESIFDSDGIRMLDDERDYKENFAALVKLTSIRTSDTTCTPGFRPYPGAPTILPPILVHDENGDVVVVNREFDDDRRAQSKMRGGILSKRAPEMQHILACVRNFHTRFNSVDLGNVYVNDKRDKYTIYLTGVGSQYCSNLAGRFYHNSNTSRLEMIKDPKDDSAKIRQLCNSTCEDTVGRSLTGGPNGNVAVSCAKYKGPWIQVSKEVADNCWPTFLTKASSSMQSVWKTDVAPEGHERQLWLIVSQHGAAVEEAVARANGSGGAVSGSSFIQPRNVVRKAGSGKKAGAVGRASSPPPPWSNSNLVPLGPPATPAAAAAAASAASGGAPVSERDAFRQSVLDNAKRYQAMAQFAKYSDMLMEMQATLAGPLEPEDEERIRSKMADIEVQLAKVRETEAAAPPWTEVTGATSAMSSLAATAAVATPSRSNEPRTIQTTADTVPKKRKRAVTASVKANALENDLPPWSSALPVSKRPR